MNGRAGPCRPFTIHCLTPGGEPDGADAGGARALDVRRPGVADHHRFVRPAAEAIEGDGENRRIGLRHAGLLRHDQRVDERLEAAQPQLVALLLEQVVRHDPDPDQRLQRHQQVARAGDRLARGEIRGAIRRRGVLQQPLVGGHAGLHEQPAEPLDAGVVDPHLAGEHALVQHLEEPGVIGLELVEAEAGETGVAAVHATQRGTRRRGVIEQGVVEIEQHHPGDEGRWHTLIIRRGCMVD